MATTRDPRVRKAAAYQGQKRQLRKPQHRFSLQFRPYQVQPFAIAPVLPGETLKNLLLQARVLTDPLKPEMKLTGWWCEQYYFYVKHRDMSPVGAPSPRTVLTNMVLDPATDVSSLKTGAVTQWNYTFNGAMDFVTLCTQRVIEEYFRDPGENWNDADKLLGGVPMAAIYGLGLQDALERLTLNANKRTDESDFSLLSADGKLRPREMDMRFQHWQALRDAGLMQMDYQNFIQTYGAQTREDEDSPNLHRPELLRYERQWQYPTNIVQASTGVPSVAVAWQIADRVDKDFKFDEPGFIIAFMCCRPKIYLGSQEGAIVGAMDTGQYWLPALTNDNFELAYKSYALNTGPLKTVMAAVPYWIDVRDLFLNGDQFVNYAMAAIPGMASLPLASGVRRYVTSAFIDALFNAAAPANLIRGDGVAHFSISGQQRRSPLAGIGL